MPDKRTRDLIRLAGRYGFDVSYTRNGHLRLDRDGCPPVFAGSSPSDHRAIRNLEARLRRAVEGRPL